MTDNDPRLPTHVRPDRYELELAPDLESATFRGAVIIHADLLEDADQIVCHAAELSIDSVAVITAGVSHSPGIELDETSERLTLSFDSEIAAGPLTIHITFTGVLNDQLRGFYRSTWTDDDDVTHTIATTQFQSTDARRAFPCWDEPAWKATFETTLIVDPTHLAVANTSAVTESTDPDGRIRITFAETMRMSTYLVAFVVGPLEITDPVDAGGVPVRVVHRPGQGHLTEFALEVATHALEWFADYYDIAYPSDKVDLLAIPDFAFGAMENLGCITFREVLLLVDPDTASQPELQHVADVVNHELAHMWFGDLVTMQWWEGIWLNEAFATFMETSCSDAFRPDWQVWTTFGRSRSMAFDVDALASTRPIEFPVITAEDAEDMFDVLTYEKGASVVRMLEQHLGADSFRDGVRHYLAIHAYGNTETSDLWDALEEVSRQPVRQIMNDWIYQGGYPVIDLDDTPNGLRLSQRHFTLDPDAADTRTWSVPIGLRTIQDDQVSETRVLLEQQSMILTGVSGSVLSANTESSGFYRVSGSHLTGTGDDDLSQQLSADERHARVDDAWALTVAGETTAIDFLALAEAHHLEDDLTVWQVLSGGLSHLVRLTDGDAGSRLSVRITTLAQPALHRIGLDPGTADNDRTKELRATLIRLLGTVAEDPTMVDRCRDLLNHGDPTLAAAALSVVAHNGSRADFESVRATAHGADDPQTEQRSLRALADFPDSDLIDILLDEILNGVVRSQDGPYLIRRALTNRHAGPLVWDFVERNWESLIQQFPSNSVSRMLAGITALDDELQIQRVAEFLTSHPIPQGEKQIAQHLERQRINGTFRQREQLRFSSAILS